MSQRRIKRCQVCGDEASGFNFTVLTCGSCRLFFHRNYTKLKELTCRRENACTVDSSNRKACSKCRLTKCFDIGMRKKPPKVSSTSEDSASTSSGSELAFPPSPSSGLTSASTEMRRTLAAIEDILEISIRDEVTRAQISQSYLAADSQPFFVAWSSDPSNSTLNLNRHEHRHLQSLNRAFSIFANEHDAKIVQVSDDVVSSFNMPAIYVTKIVKFCKQFPDFKSLSQEVQLLVLKLFYTECLAIRVAFNYDIENGGYPLIQDETGQRVLFVKSDSLLVMKQKDLVVQNRQMLYKLKMEFENDVDMRNIATAMLLFKPRDCLPCNEAMRYKYFQYCNLLRRYLEQKYNSIEAAREKFTRILNVTDELEIVRRNYGTLLKEFNGNQVVQVLAEVFNIQK